MNHTTDPIDVKIWLQFMQIEEYLSGFIFDVRLAFKRRFNGCEIESTKQEDLEELKNFL